MRCLFFISIIFSSDPQPHIKTSTLIQANTGGSEPVNPVNLITPPVFQSHTQNRAMGQKLSKYNVDPKPAKGSFGLWCGQKGGWNKRYYCFLQKLPITRVWGYNNLLFKMLTLSNSLKKSNNLVRLAKVFYEKLKPTVYFIDYQFATMPTMTLSTNPREHIVY